MTQQSKDEAEVFATMEKYSRAYAQHDLDSLLQLFAHDSNIVVIGTGVNEKRIGFEEVKKQFQLNFSETQDLRIAWDWYKISVVSDLAWVIADATIKVTVGDRKTRLPVRVTIVLERRGGSWYWVHRHASFPASNQKPGTAYPTGN